MKRRSKDAGVTLIEILVVIAIIGIITAALIPLVTRYIDDSRVARAKSDCDAIRTSMLAFYKDTGRWPDTDGTTTALPSNLVTLFSAGTRASGGGPGAWGDATAASTRMNVHLVVNNPGANDYPVSGDTGWRGPYLPGDTADPWGRAYEINIQGAYTATGTEPSAVYCMSAGPDGTIGTAFLQASSSATIAGDDIAIRIR